MKAVFAPLWPRLLVLGLLVLCCCLIFATGLCAAETSATNPGGPLFATLQANAIMQIVSDRSKLIQVSLVCVFLGCSLLWWRR